jgi:hypothetical protein
MLNDDTVTPEVSDPQTPATPAEEPSGGTQPASEPATTTPPPDKSAGSEPSIPLSRFNEVIRERNELRQRFQQPQAPQQPNTLPQAPKQEDFQDFEAYNAAVIDHRVQQGIQTYERNQQQANAQRQYQDRANKAMNNFSQKLVEAVSKDPTVQAIIESAPPLRPDLQVNLGEFKDPVALAKHLAMNPSMVYEMNNLPPDLAVQRMGGAQAYSNDMSQEEYNASFKPLW